MKRLAVIGMLLGAVLAGCGSSGATEEELSTAYRHGEERGERVEKRDATAEAAVVAVEAQEERTLLNEVAKEVEEEALEEEVEAEEAELEEVEEETNAYLESEGINPAPIKENGEPSYEFSPEDIERAEDAPSTVREYCEGAVSEAQEVGCLSHVEEDEVP